MDEKGRVVTIFKFQDSILKHFETIILIELIREYDYAKKLVFTWEFEMRKSFENVKLVPNYLNKK